MLFSLYRKSIIKKTAEAAEEYANKNIIKKAHPEISYSKIYLPAGHDSSGRNLPERDVKYSLKGVSEAVKAAMENIPEPENTFVSLLIYYMNLKNLKNTDVYKAANIDKRLFSKITSDANYKPSKDTCLALIFSLKLSLEQANKMLKSAGYAFSHSIRRDLIIEFLIREKMYNLTDVNLVLSELNEIPIGDKKSH